MVWLVVFFVVVVVVVVVLVVGEKKDIFALGLASFLLCSFSIGGGGGFLTDDGSWLGGGGEGVGPTWRRQRGCAHERSNNGNGI